MAGQGAVLTGLTQGGAVFPKDLRVGDRLTLQISHRQHGVPVGQHRITGHADGRAHRQRDSGGGEGRQLAVHVIAHTGSDLVEEGAAGCQVVRHLHLHRGDQVAVLHRDAAGTHSLNGHGVILCVVALRGVIALRGLEILGECHGAVGILPIQADDRVAPADGAVTPDLQRHIAAHGGHGLHVGHTDEILRAAALHGEVAGLGGLVSSLVTKRYRHRVRTVDKLHLIVDIPVAGRNSGVLCYIDAVYTEAHGIGIHTGIIFAVRVAEIGAQVKRTPGNRAVSYQLLIVDSDGGHLRVSHIVYIRAVYELEIIKVNRTSRAGSHHCAVYEHQPQGVAAVDGIRRRQVCQIGFQILPACPVNSGLCSVPNTVTVKHLLRLKGEIICQRVVRCCFHIAAQPKSSLCFIALIRDTDTLRGIDPHTEACRLTVYRKIRQCTNARTFGYLSTVREIVIQLQGFLAKAHRFAVCAADDLDGFVAATSIVVVGQDTAFAAVIILRRLRNTAAVIRLVLKVPNHDGKHTDHDLDRAVYGFIKRRGGGDVRRYAACFCGSENITCKTTHIRLFHRPHDVAILVVHISVLIMYHQTQIGFLVKVQTDLVRVEGDGVRLHQLHRGGADHIVTPAQQGGDNADAVRSGRKQTGGRVDRAQRGGVRRQLPHQTLRQRRCAAAAVYAHGAKLHGRAGRIQLIAGGDQRVVKYAVLRNGGNADETGADGPLVTVGGLAEHLQLAALFAGREGRGAAAIEVQSRHAAGVLQDSCHLIEVHTDGAGRQTALRHEEHDAAVIPDTHTVSGVHRSVAGHLDLTVPQKVERAGDGFHYIVRRGSGVTDDRGAVRQDRKIRLVGGLDHVALHDQVTRGLAGAHVEVVAVGGHDDRACRIGDRAVVRGQPRGFLQAPLTLADLLSIRDTIRRRASGRVVAVVGGLERYVLGQVDLRHVTNGLMILLVSHDDLVVGHTIGNGMVRLYDRRQARRLSCAAQRDRTPCIGLRCKRHQNIRLSLIGIPFVSRLGCIGILRTVCAVCLIFPRGLRSGDVRIPLGIGVILPDLVDQGNRGVFRLFRAVLNGESHGNGV